jgi:predicted enzyme related to lactoylglutathione lyase
MSNKQPTFGNGKICYLEIPSTDLNISANFYKNCFDWSTRIRGDGSVAFDDGVGEVSGTWCLDRAPSSNPGIYIHIMIFDIEQTIEKIIANGGNILQHPDKNVREKTAKFSDPAGNILCLYQHGK